MKSAFKFLSLLVAPFLLSSCISFDNPLSERTFSDKKLAGVWHARVEGNDEYLHIFDLPDGKTLKLIRVTHISTGGIGNSETLEMYPTITAHAHYMNLKVNSAAAEEGKQKEGWLFARYEITPADELKVSLIDYDCLKNALDKKYLQGKAWETTWGSNAQITDGSKTLLEFVDSANAEFKPHGVYHHVVDARAAAAATAADVGSK